VGQTFVFHGFRFEILGRQRNQITTIKMAPLGEDTSPPLDAAVGR